MGTFQEAFPGARAGDTGIKRILSDVGMLAMERADQLSKDARKLPPLFPCFLASAIYTIVLHSCLGFLLPQVLIANPIMCVYGFHQTTELRALRLRTVTARTRA